MTLSIKKKTFLLHQAVHMAKLNMDQQVCVIKTVAFRAWTDKQKHRHTPHGQTKKN